jgi:hypothetical protein
VVAVEDVSLPGVVRLVLRVHVEGQPTADELRHFARQLAGVYRQLHHYQALRICFYAYPELAFGLADLGIWVDAPYGDWARANEATPGDYRVFTVDGAAFEKDWALLPSREQVALWAAFSEKLAELHTDPMGLPSDEVVAAAVAADRGIAAEEVLAAQEAVLVWQFNGR